MRQLLPRFVLTAVLGLAMGAAFITPANAQVSFGNFAPGVTINATHKDSGGQTGGITNFGVAFTTDASIQTPITDLRLAVSVPTLSVGIHAFITDSNVDSNAATVVLFTAASTVTTTPQGIDFTPTTEFTPLPSTTYYLHVDSTSNPVINWYYVDDAPQTFSDYYNYNYGAVANTFASSDRGGYYLLETAVIPEASTAALILGGGALGAGLVFRRYRKRDTVKVQG